MQTTTQWWQVLGAVAAALGAIAAAVGAAAARRAATAARDTSRDALEALAVGIRPRLRAEFGILTEGDERGQPRPPKLVAWIANQSEWPARDVSLELRFRNGHTVSDRAAQITPTPKANPIHQYEWRADLGEPPPPGSPLEKHAERAVLRYSDDRGTAEYIATYTFVLPERQDGTVTAQSSAIEIDEHRYLQWQGRETLSLRPASNSIYDNALTVWARLTAMRSGPIPPSMGSGAPRQTTCPRQRSTGQACR